MSLVYFQSFLKEKTNQVKIFLDSFQSKLLDWPMRFNILCAIARGLQYRHQDSRLRIIHRDLKASHVLLDDNLNPKISDFGLTKICGLKGIQTEFLEHSKYLNRSMLNFNNIH